MRLEAFVSSRRPAWQELEALLADAGARSERLGPDRLRRLGALYRSAAADLALARRAFPGDPATAALERLVLRARQAVYADERGSGGLRHFLLTGYWQRIRERPGLLWLATALLFVPAALGIAWSLDDPAAAVGILPEAFREAIGQGAPGPDEPIAPADEAVFSTQVFTNNIRVTLLAVAGGLTLGLGTAAVTIYNGLFLGAFAGLVGGAGYTEEFVTLVAAHGVLELSCIVVATMAGLRVGWAIVAPGTLTRPESLRREMRPAMEIVLGTAPWLVLAGLIEGFVTGSLPGLTAALAIGFGVGGVYWALVFWRGRPTAAPAPSP